jgi:hypothetical protein
MSEDLELVRGSDNPFEDERNRFESSYATRLNRSAGLYFGWRP